MSEQIQYNYYNTVTTKTGDNSFIFRGKRNMPNLVLQNGDSYISTKLTIKDGIVEIEHDPITNYSKRVIAIFTISPIIDIKIGESKEINLNSIIPKSIRFDIDESGDAIFLHPATSSVGSVEGFCNNAMCRELQKGIDEVRDRIAKQESSSGGSLSDDDYAAMAARIAAMNGSGLDGDGGGGELVCTPITDSEDNEMTLVGVTNTLSELEMSKAAEASVYQQSAINVIVFIGGFLLISKAVCGLYQYTAHRIMNPSILTGIELVLVLLFISMIGITLAFVKKAPAQETSEEAGARNSANFLLINVATIMILMLTVFMYFVYDYRKTTFAVDKQNTNDLERFNRIFGNRDCYTVLKFLESGAKGIRTYYTEYIIKTPVANKSV